MQDTSGRSILTFKCLNMYLVNQRMHIRNKVHFNCFVYKDLSSTQNILISYKTITFIDFPVYALWFINKPMRVQFWGSRSIAQSTNATLRLH